jgi:hypothetical protein
MEEMVKSVFTAPIATLFIVAGMLFLLIAVVGKISGKIEPGERARMVSGVAGLIFISLGLTIHFTQTEKKTGSGIRDQKEKLNDHINRKEKVLSSPVETSVAGVVANISRFEKSGELVILELTVQNRSDEKVRFCTFSGTAELIDQATGQKWRALHHGGGVGDCGPISANLYSTAWMQFKIPNPETRVFTLSLKFLNKALDNLKLAERS